MFRSLGGGGGGPISAAAVELGGADGTSVFTTVDGPVTLGSSVTSAFASVAGTSGGAVSDPMITEATVSSDATDPDRPEASASLCFSSVGNPETMESGAVNAAMMEPGAS